MNELQERVKTQFASVYLTLTSVIQASVLGYFFIQVSDSIPKLQWRSGLLIVNSFLIIGIVWNEYAMGASAFRWVPGLRDAFLPLIIGICQFLMIRSISQRGSFWFIWLASLAFACFLASINMYHSARRDPENRTVFEVLGRWPLVSELYLLLSAVTSLILAWVDSRIDAGRGEWTLSAEIATGVVAIYLARTWYYWRRIIRT